MSGIARHQHVRWRQSRHCCVIVHMAGTDVSRRGYVRTAHEPSLAGIQQTVGVRTIWAEGDRPEQGILELRAVQGGGAIVDDTEEVLDVVAGAGASTFVAVD